MGSDRARRRGVAPTPASFRRVCTPGSQRTRDRGGNTVRERARRGAPGCACAAGAVPHRRNRRHQPFPSIQTPSRSLTTPASAISEVAWRETEEESSSSRARQRNGRKRTCVNKASPRFYRAGRRLSGRLYPRRTLTGLWSITRASRTRRPLRRYEEPRSRRAPLCGPRTRAT